MNFETRHDSLGSQVAAALREDILNAAYAKGENLTESMLCRRYSVSRTPVREAMRQLEMEGLIAVTPNKSPVVIGVSESDILDMFDIRICLEGLAARKAAQNITPDGLAALKESIDLLEFYSGKGDAGSLTGVDTRFHEAIYAASGSGPLKSVLQNFQRYTKIARARSFADRARAQQALAEHMAIYEAVACGDGAKAQALAEQHAANAKAQYCKQCREGSE